MRHQWTAALPVPAITGKATDHQIKRRGCIAVAATCYLDKQPTLDPSVDRCGPGASGYKRGRRHWCRHFRPREVCGGPEKFAARRGSPLNDLRCGSMKSTGQCPSTAVDDLDRVSAGFKAPQGYESISERGHAGSDGTRNRDRQSIHFDRAVDLFDPHRQPACSVLKFMRIDIQRCAKTGRHGQLHGHVAGPCGDPGPRRSSGTRSGSMSPMHSCRSEGSKSASGADSGRQIAVTGASR